MPGPYLFLERHKMEVSKYKTRAKLTLSEDRTKIKKDTNVLKLLCIDALLLFRTIWPEPPESLSVEFPITLPKGATNVGPSSLMLPIGKGILTFSTQQRRNLVLESLPMSS